MDYSRLPVYDIEAGLVPLTSLPNMSHQQQEDHCQQSTSPQQTLQTFNFESSISQFPPRFDLHDDSERKVFFITNCGGLLGKTIARVALNRGHYVAACARERHLADLNVRPLFDGLMAEFSDGVS